MKDENTFCPFFGVSFNKTCGVWVRQLEPSTNTTLSDCYDDGSSQNYKMTPEELDKFIDDIPF